MAEASTRPAIEPSSVLIRTVPPTSNANYGGILQAWALQRVVNGLGFKAYVDATRKDALVTRKVHFRRSMRRTMRNFIRPNWIPQKMRGPVYRDQVDRALLEFAPKEMDLFDVYRPQGHVDPRALEFGAYIVGSDQVWRPEYSDVASYLLDFLPADFAGRRISYAASFGVDRPNFGSALSSITKPLAQRFSAVSVREASGIEACKSLWGVDAVRVPDPTLLVPVSYYVELEQHAGLHTADDTLVTYVLDGSAGSKTAADGLARQLGVQILEADWHEVRNVATGVPAAVRARASVYDWLRHMRTASFIVTDSYHGCVFATLFHRPFLVVPNLARGRARFDTLLGDLGLERRVVGWEDLTADRMNEEISWADVAERLDRLATMGTDYLVDALGARTQQPDPQP